MLVVFSYASVIYGDGCINVKYKWWFIVSFLTLMKIISWRVFWKLLNDFGFCLSHCKSLATGFNCICKQQNIGNDKKCGNDYTNNRGSLLFSKPFPYFVSSFSPFFLTFFDNTLLPHGCNYCSVSWEKSRWKIEVKGNKENGLCSCSFLFLSSPQISKKKKEKSLLRFYGIIKRKKKGEK